MSAVLRFQRQLSWVECANCNMAFGLSVQFEQDRRTDHATFYCPLGHSNYFPGKSEAEKLREQLAEKERTLEWERSQKRYAQAESIARFHKLNATKAVVTKIKKKLARVENGVCPECNRTFANVARHMQTQHGIECNTPPKGSKVRG